MFSPNTSVHKALTFHILPCILLIEKLFTQKNQSNCKQCIELVTTHGHLNSVLNWNQKQKSPTLLTTLLTWGGNQCFKHCPLPVMESFSTLDSPGKQGLNALVLPVQLKCK